VPLRWYVISLLAPPLILLVALTVLYGLAPLRAPNQNWLLIFTSFLPALVIAVVLNNVAEEIGMDRLHLLPGFKIVTVRFARRF
jgi:fumarate reductase subunit D